MNCSALDDLELLALIRKGSEAAFAEVYKRYWSRVYGLALTFTKSSQAAEDTVQEVFLKLWTHRESLDRVRAFKPFLFVSARNLIISHLRKSVFHVALTNDDFEEDAFLPEKQLTYKESVALLYRAIEQLPPQQRQAYKLSRDEGLRYEDIALKMGISPLTVRTHVTKALAFIRRYLTDHSASPIVLLLFLLNRKG